MKTLYIFLLVILISCQKDVQSQSFKDYVLRDEILSGIKEFYCETDTTFIIYLKQNTKFINDSIVEIEHIWSTMDSIVFNRSMERYYSNGKFLLINQSYTELDSITGETFEVKAEIINNRELSMQHESCSYDLRYKFKTDSDLIMTTNIELNPEIQNSDTLDLNCKDCLILNSKETVLLDYFDQRNDTVIYSESISIFKKGSGLVYFAQNNNGNNTAFRLKN